MFGLIAPMNTELQNRLKGMVLGQFIGDAVSLGVHWIYNTKDIESAYPDGLLGFEVPAEGHYHAGKQSGDPTHYGYAAWVLLESLTEETFFEAATFGKAFVEKMDPSKGYSGYFDSATRGTLENYKNHLEISIEPYPFQEGSDDDQLATISVLAVLIAFYVARNHGLPEDPADLLEQVEKLTRVRQNNDRAVAYCQAHTRLLLELLAGRDIHSAFHHVEEQLDTEAKLDREVRRKLREAFQLKHKNTIEATDLLGQSCPLICSFPSAVQATAKHNEDFQTAILETARAGGDNAGRSAMIGSWIGARLGVEKLPEDWIQKLNGAPKIFSILEGWGL
ncbi:MAG TPA: ADP-ribosylglycohydrolase family protein [Opitutae bacterium]|nr:ADP-ribosylglycohydrolase family protein [Opitutae bacterium]